MASFPSRWAARILCRPEQAEKPYGVTTDASSRLQYNRDRWYDATTGTWTSEDPREFSAGDSNLDRYVRNAPTDATDPSGDFFLAENDQAAKLWMERLVGIGLKPQPYPINQKTSSLIYFNFPFATNVGQTDDIAARYKGKYGGNDADAQVLQAAIRNPSPIVVGAADGTVQLARLSSGELLSLDEVGIREGWRRLPGPTQGQGSGMGLLFPQPSQADTIRAGTTTYPVYGVMLVLTEDGSVGPVRPVAPDPEACDERVLPEPVQAQLRTGYFHGPQGGNTAVPADFTNVVPRPERPGLSPEQLERERDALILFGLSLLPGTGQAIAFTEGVMEWRQGNRGRAALSFAGVIPWGRAFRVGNAVVRGTYRAGTGLFRLELRIAKPFAKNPISTRWPNQIPAHVEREAQAVTGRLGLPDLNARVPNCEVLRRAGIGERAVIDGSELLALSEWHKAELSLGVVRRADGSRLYVITYGTTGEVGALTPEIVNRRFGSGSTLERVVHTQPSGVRPSNADLRIALANPNGTEIVARAVGSLNFCIDSLIM
jgi:RHS repeat-associated protein